MKSANHILELGKLRRQSLVVTVLIWAAFGICYLLAKMTLGHSLIIERPGFFWWLILSPVFLVSFWYFTKGKRERLRLLADPELLSSIAKNINYLGLMRSYSMLQLVLMLVVFGATIPRYGSQPLEAEISRAEVMVAIDVSKSMLVEDVSPDRLEQAKRIVTQLISQLGNDRLGLIVFAGSAYVQMPLTDDLFSAQVFLNSIATDVVPRQGTSLAAAIELASESYPDDMSASRALIILTDGEDHSEGVENALERAEEADVEIAIIGIGTSDGGPIPIIEKGRRSYKKDKSGSVVVSHMETRALEKMASSVGADLFFAEDKVNLDELNQWIKDLQRSGTTTVNYSEKTHLYSTFFLLAALTLIFGIWFRKG